MLPAAVRLTRNQDFRLVVRRGRRAGRTRLVLHLLEPAQSPRSASDVRPAPTHNPDRQRTDVRVGFVVSKAVGTAVIRHRVTRRLRHLMRERIALLRPGTLVVVRALPPAATAPSHELAADLDAAFRKLGVASPRGE